MRWVQVTRFEVFYDNNGWRLFSFHWKCEEAKVAALRLECKYGFHVAVYRVCGGQMTTVYESPPKPEMANWTEYGF